MKSGLIVGLTENCTKRLGFSLGIGLALVAQLQAATNLVDNGSFETPAQAIGTHYHLPLGSMGAWQTNGTAFEIWANPNPDNLAHDGTQHLELIGQGFGNTVFQDIATAVGQQYRLEFYHSPRPAVDSTMTVWINSQSIGSFIENGTSITAFAWQGYSTTFIADSLVTTIKFTDVTTVEGQGTHLDHVQLYAVPEPTTLLLHGLTGIALLYRRRENS